jgi:O-antigen/teichoic acid export membrane protein
MQVVGLKAVEKLAPNSNVFSIRKLMVHLRTPLYLNGYALLLSGFTSAGLGMIYWLLAAHSYAPATVGLSSAAISAMMLLSGASQLSLNSALVRFVPRAGRATGRLVGYSYLISAMAAAAIGLIFCLGLEHWAPALSPFLVSPMRQQTFVLAIVIWCIFSLQDSVLTGLRQTMWVPLENTVVTLVKIVLLLVFARYSRQYGIFAAWMIPVALSLLPLNLLIFRRLIPDHVQASEDLATRLVPRQIGKYIVANYLGSLFFLASTTLLPIIVINQIGPKANAYFYMPWMIATALQLIAVNMTTSFTVEATRDQMKLRIYCYRVLMQSMRLLIPVVIIILLGAPLILRLFGRDYANEGSTLLRLLALSAIPNVIVVLYISIARVRNRVRGIVMVQGALCVLVLSMSYVLLEIFGITGVGLAWLASQTAMAVFLWLTRLRTTFKTGGAAYEQERRETLAV